MPLKLSSPLSLIQKNWYKALAFFIFVIVLSALFLYFVILRVKKVQVSVPSSTTILGIEALYGQSMLLLSPDKIEKQIIQRNPIVKEVVTHYIYPDTLTLKVQLSKPVVNFESDKGYFILNEDGIVLQKMQGTNTALPVMKFYQKMSYSQIQPGNRIDFQEVRSGMYFLKSALDLGLRIDTIDINGLSMIALYVSKPGVVNPKIVFTTQKDKEQQIFELRTIIKKLSLEGKEFKSIDLRFKRPIIIF